MIVVYSIVKIEFTKNANVTVSDESKYSTGDFLGTMCVYGRNELVFYCCLINNGVSENSPGDFVVGMS